MGLWDVPPVVFNAAVMTRARYTVVRKIASGGMAEIYLGTQHGAAGFERPIIIKRIRPEFSASAQFQTMLQDEARIAMGMHQGNVAQVLDLGTSNGQWFLVLELVDGWDVDTLLKRCTAAGMTFPPALALYITAQVCRGLQYAHTRERDGAPLNIVHRDVSPENILVSDQGEVKLADFGIATAANKQEKTSAGIVKGKLGFMSPEQANGYALDARTDIYGLGCALYVMITGARPFQGKTELEMLLRHQEGAFIPPTDVAPDMHPELVALLLKSMAKDAADRFSSADEMLLEVERVQRSAFGAAGQTELRQWLQELSLWDQTPSTTKRPPPLRKPGDNDSGIPDLADGSALILQDVGVSLASNNAPLEDAITQPSMEIPADMTAAARPERAGLPAWAVGAAVVAVVAVGGVLAQPLWQDLAVTAETAGPDEPPVARPADPTPVNTVPTPPVDPTPAPVAMPDAAVVAAADASATPPDAAVEAEEEPVKEDEPVAEEEEPPAPTPAPAPAPVAQGTSRAAPTPQEKRASPTSISVKLESDPQGATVLVNNKVFGTTPTRVRFKPGLTHDVVFRKEGYTEQVRRVYVSNAKNQAVQVTLVKAQGKKKGWWPF